MSDENGQNLPTALTTPCYLLDLDRLERRVAYLRAHLPDDVKLCYAAKANTFLLKKISTLVDYLELCSPGELRISEQLGLDSRKFVISGVLKRREEIEEMIAAGDMRGIYTAESRGQFEVLRDAAASHGVKIPVLLRLTSGSQFGMDESEVDAIIASRKETPSVEIRGIHYFSGTQKSSVKKVKRELSHLDDFLAHLAEDYGFEAERLEYGGGFPVSYFEGNAFDEDAYLAEVSELLHAMTYKGTVVIELGRSIAASCGTYLTTVMDTKCNHKEWYAIVDGGMHQFVYFGQSMAMKRPHMHMIGGGHSNETESWNICGSLCTVNDILVKQLPIKGLCIGDVLAFENTGAYCMTEGISLFLSRDLPAVVLKENGQYETVRAHTETDYLNYPGTWMRTQDE